MLTWKLARGKGWSIPGRGNSLGKGLGAGGSLGSLGKGEKVRVAAVFVCSLACLHMHVCACVFMHVLVCMCGVHMQVYTWVQVPGPSLSAWQINSPLSALRLCFYLCSKST